MAHASSSIETLVSSGRYNAYLNAAGGEHASAMRLYQWNVSASAACFEAFHYVEVVVRNAIDRELRVYFDETNRSIPWFLMPVVQKHQATFDENIEKVRKRLRLQGASRETRDQIIAGVDFSFWTSLLHSENEDLWRRALHKSFPNSSGKRKDVVAPLEQLRVFRNKLAHHDSLLWDDLSFRLQQMLTVLRWVDTAAEAWLSSVERVTAVNEARPVGRRDTVVVAAKSAWPLYKILHAYICQAGRSFQPVEHLGFYADREIKPEIPSIIHRTDNVEWSSMEAKRLQASSSQAENRLAQIMNLSLRNGQPEGRFQVFDLSCPGDEGHITIEKAIPHNERGRGSAFTQNQRYVTLSALKRAHSTAHLG